MSKGQGDVVYPADSLEGRVIKALRDIKEDIESSLVNGSVAPEILDIRDSSQAYLEASTKIPSAFPRLVDSVSYDLVRGGRNVADIGTADLTNDEFESLVKQNVGKRPLGIESKQPQKPKQPLPGWISGATVAADFAQNGVLSQLRRHMSGEDDSRPIGGELAGGIIGTFLQNQKRKPPTQIEPTADPQIVEAEKKPDSPEPKK